MYGSKSPFLATLIIGIIVMGAPLGFSLEMEVGTIDLNNNTDSFQFQNFAQTYDTAPLVFFLNNEAESKPATLHAQNVSQTGFEISQLFPSDNNTSITPTTVSYFAIEPGVHELPGGIKIEAGSISTTTFTSKFQGQNWETVNFNTSFPGSASVLANVQTRNNGDTWMTRSVINVDSDSADIALERAEVTAGSINNPETIGYVAMQDGAEGSFQDLNNQTIAYKALNSSDNIQGHSQGPQSVSFNKTFAQSPHVFGNRIRRDGGNGGWLRLANTSTTSASFVVDEDQANDSERSHTTEQASVFAFSNTFVFNSDPDAVIPGLVVICCCSSED